MLLLILKYSYKKNCNSAIIIKYMEIIVKLW